MSLARWAKQLAAFAVVVVFAGIAPEGLAQAQADDAPSPPAAAPEDAVQPDQPASEPAAPPASELNGIVAAIVNDEVITVYDLRQRSLLLIVTAGVPPTRENLPQIQQEALRSLIDEALQLQELKRMEEQQKFSLIADDTDVNAALAGLAADNNSTVEQLTAQFALMGLDIDTLKNQLRVQMSWQRLVSGRYGNRVRVGENQISMVMQRLKAGASQPQYELSEIFIDAARAGGMREALGGAQQLLAQMQQGAPFAAVARQFSSAPSAANGGDMGWISAAELQPELAQAVEQMRPGQLSAPVQVGDGVYILALQSKRAGGGQTLVNLKQAAVRLAADAPDSGIQAARQALEALRASSPDCDSLQSKAAAVPGVIAGDLGESDMNDLGPDFRSAAEGLGVGQLSQPIRTPVGLHLIMVCGRRQTDANLPSKADIENRLFRDQISMLGRRYLRDLRNSATIETP
jgi:peptidyl-prolyl cis-trans isomerase SurA